MTSPEAFDAGAASQIGHYADAVRVDAADIAAYVAARPHLRSSRTASRRKA